MKWAWQRAKNQVNSKQYMSFEYIFLEKKQENKEENACQSDVLKIVNREKDVGKPNKMSTNPPSDQKERERCEKEKQ